jgi:hypothetical protein
MAGVLQESLSYQLYNDLEAIAPGGVHRDVDLGR